jgi:tetratricopeptide (TPR) repeat protein
MHIHSQVRLVVLLPILAAACAPANLDPSDPGLQLLVVGRYSDASRVLAAELKQDPDNPYIAFNLAAAYQNLDRMDLAAPLYRKVIRDGGDVVPRSATDPYEAGMTLSDMACTNLRRGLHDNFTC